jgi:hypothetical protein
MKKIIFTLLLVSSLNTIAQETTESIIETKESNIDLGVDVQSRYIWRGLQLGGNSPSLQPYVEISAGKFAFGAWGAYSTGGVNNAQEADLYISYSPTDVLSFTITDYFFPTEGALNNYFEYGDETDHVFEAMVSFAGIEGFPIALSLATNIGGGIKYDDNGDEKKAYSTYLEASYSKEVAGTAYSTFVGAVFGDNNGYYLTDGSGFINLGVSASKEVKITDYFSLPVNAVLIFNPDQENIYLTFGFSL